MFSTTFQDFSRRDLLKFSLASAFGVTCSGWLPHLARAAAGGEKHKACILLWMAGGPSQTDTFDLKVGHANGGPSTNLQAGGCRFGRNPETSVLDPDCRVHDATNVFVTDGSFMPTGGSVPYTWTIYANAFRVAEKIVSELGGRKG